MDDDDLNEDILEGLDLAFDENTKGKFRAAVTALKSGASTDGGTGDSRATADALANWIAANVDENSAMSVRAATNTVV